MSPRSPVCLQAPNHIPRVRFCHPGPSINSFVISSGADRETICEVEKPAGSVVDLDSASGVSPKSPLLAKTEAVKKPSLNSRAGERARLGEAVAETWFVF